MFCGPKKLKNLTQFNFFNNLQVKYVYIKLVYTAYIMIFGLRKKKVILEKNGPYKSTFFLCF